MIRCDRKAAKGIQFHSRRHGVTILPNLNGIWGRVDKSGHLGMLGSNGQAAIRYWWPTITFIRP